jgi:hypothetical protein
VPVGFEAVSDNHERLSVVEFRRWLYLWPSFSASGLRNTGNSGWRAGAMLPNAYIPVGTRPLDGDSSKSCQQTAVSHLSASGSVATVHLVSEYDVSVRENLVLSGCIWKFPVVTMTSLRDGGGAMSTDDSGIDLQAGGGGWQTEPRREISGEGFSRTASFVVCKGRWTRVSPPDTILPILGWCRRVCSGWVGLFDNRLAKANYGTRACIIWAGLGPPVGAVASRYECVSMFARYALKLQSLFLRDGVIRCHMLPVSGLGYRHAWRQLRPAAPRSFGLRKVENRVTT